MESGLHGFILHWALQIRWLTVAIFIPIAINCFVALEIAAILKNKINKVDVVGKLFEKVCTWVVHQVGYIRYIDKIINWVFDVENVGNP